MEPRLQVRVGYMKPGLRVKVRVRVNGARAKAIVDSRLGLDEG